MTNLKTFFVAAMLAGALLLTGGLSDKAQAQWEGDFQFRLLGTGIFPVDDLGRTTLGGNLVTGADASTNVQVIPAITLTKFLTPNIAVELFCCISTHTVNGRGALSGFGELANTSFFAPNLTVQYHIPIGIYKPYVGVGVNYLLFFDEGVGSGLAASGNGITDVHIDDSWGLTLQAGLDVALAGGWSLNFDAKKLFNETDVRWTGGGATIVDARDLQLDPWIISVGLGFRFNSCALFDRCAPEPLK